MFLFSRNKKFVFSIAILAVVGIFILTGFVLAQDQFGLENAGMGLGNNSLKSIISNIVNVAFGFLGIVAVLIILYGGFLWMTSGGNQDQVEKAKQLLIAAVIGLTIILSAYAIASFVISRFGAATGMGMPETCDLAVDTTRPCNAGCGVQTCLASGFWSSCINTGSCSSIVLPEQAGWVNRFSSDNSNWQENISYNFAGVVSVPQSDDIELTAYARNRGGSIDDTHLFETEGYGSSVFLNYGQFNPYNTSDEELNTAINWDISPKDLQSKWKVKAAITPNGTGSDFDSPEVRAIIRPINCFNGIMDAGEADIDCGGDATALDYCGACPGDPCDSDTNTLACEPEDSICSGQGKCLPASCLCARAPIIDDISPVDGAVGTYVTLHGRNFGSDEGVVLINGVSANLSLNPNCDNVWTESQIIFEVPNITNSSYDVVVQTNASAGGLASNSVGFEVNDVVRPGLCKAEPNYGVYPNTTTLYGVNLLNQGGGARLIAYYPFDNDINDYNRNYNATCVNCPTAITGIKDGAYFFDGSQSVVINDDDSLDFGTSDFTISAWAGIDREYFGWHGQVVNKWNTGASPGTNEWSLGFAGSNKDRVPVFSVEVGTGPSAITHTLLSDTPPLINTWYHLVGIRKGDYIKLYVNGELKDSKNIGNVAVNNVGNDLYIGRLKSHHDLYGMIDEITIWDEALDENDVLSIYNSSGISLSNMNVVWHFNPDDFTSQYPNLNSTWAIDGTSVIDQAPEARRGNTSIHVYNGLAESNYINYLLSAGGEGDPCGNTATGACYAADVCKAGLTCDLLGNNPANTLGTPCTCWPSTAMVCNNNGVKDTGEVCDGFDIPNGDQCSDYGRGSGMVACSNCQIDYSGCTGSFVVQEPATQGVYSWAFTTFDGGQVNESCGSDEWGSCNIDGCGTGLVCDVLGDLGPACTCWPAPEDLCGNGVLDAEEVCEGSDFRDSNQCSFYNLGDGTVSCNNDCSINTDQCVGAVVPEGSATQGIYGWTFRTLFDDRFEPPRVIEDCNRTQTCSVGQKLPSPTPWSEKWNQAMYPDLDIDNDRACLNAVISAQFNTEMDPATLIDPNNVKVFKCDDKEGNGCVDVVGMSVVNDNLYTFTPASPLDPASWYKVVMTSGVQSILGVPIEIHSQVNSRHCNVAGITDVAYCWNFKTRGDLSSGLVAYYPLNGNANDKSGNGHNGVLSPDGLTLINEPISKYGKAYNFDGLLDGHISMGDIDDLEGMNKLTISMWIYPEDVSDQYNTIISKGGVYSVLWRGDRDNILVNFFDEIRDGDEVGVWDQMSTPANSALSNNWYHILVTYDGDDGSEQIFINGVSQTIGGLNQIKRGRLRTDTKPFYIGKYGSWMFDGIIDDVRIYGRVLNPSEINELSQLTPEAILDLQDNPDYGLCPIGCVECEPDASYLWWYGNKKSYTAGLISNDNVCLMLNPITYSWDWNTDKPDKIKIQYWSNSNNTGEARQETIRDIPNPYAKAMATETVSDQSDYCQAYIDFTNPIVVEDRSCAGGTVQSPTPWILSENVCLNALVSARFSRFMDDSTIDYDYTNPDASIIIEECSNFNTFNYTCNGPWINANLPGTLKIFDYNHDIDITTMLSNGVPIDRAQAEGFVIDRAGTDNFDANTWYRVVIIGGDDGVRGALLDDNGAEINPEQSDGVLKTPSIDPIWDYNDDGEADYYWLFKTSDQICEVETVKVAPHNYFMEFTYETQEYNAFPQAGNCNILNRCSLDWSWQSLVNLGDSGQSGDFVASILPVVDNTCYAGDVDGFVDPIQTARARADGETNIKAVEPGNAWGSGYLKVGYDNLFVINQLPQGAGSVFNDNMAVEFNLNAQSQSVRLDMSTGNVKLYQCVSQECPLTTAVQIPLNAVYPTNPGLTNANPLFIKDLVIESSAPFIDQTNYRVVINGGPNGVKAFNGNELQGLNFNSSGSIGLGEECEPDIYPWSEQSGVCTASCLLVGDLCGTRYAECENVLPPGGMGNVLRFNGNAGGDENYVEIANDNSIDLTGEATISLWVKPFDLPVGTHNIIMYKPTGGYQNGWLLNQFGNNLQIYWQTVGGISLGHVLNEGDWQHIVIKKQGTDISLYFNNDYIGTRSIGSEIWNNDGNIFIGGGYPAWYFNGLIDEVVIYGRALDDAEISDLYNDSIGLKVDPALRFSSTGRSMGDELRGLWHFDEGGGTEAQDSSGNGNQGELMNMSDANWVAGEVAYQSVETDYCSNACHNIGNTNIASCGNGILEPGEDCDDGNSRSHDGCSSNCLWEGSNEAWGSLCLNNVIDYGEECDEGTVAENIAIGCDPDICLFAVDPDGDSGSMPNVPICGNGQLEKGEDCDDNNTDADDSCSSNCLWEGSSPCTGSQPYGSGCCGNHLVEAGGYDSYSWVFTVTEHVPPVAINIGDCPNGIWEFKFAESVSGEISICKYNPSISGWFQKIISKTKNIFAKIVGKKLAVASSSDDCGSNWEKMDISNFEKIEYIGANNSSAIVYINNNLWDYGTRYKYVINFNNLGFENESEEVIMRNSSDGLCQIDDIIVNIWPQGEKKYIDTFFCHGEECGKHTGDLYDNDISAAWNDQAPYRKVNNRPVSDPDMPGNQHLYQAWAINSDGYLLKSDMSWQVTHPPFVSIENDYTHTIYNGDRWITSADAGGDTQLTLRAEYNGAGLAEKTVNIKTFLCNNPWPSPRDFPYYDSDNNCSDATATCINTNFEVYYCRDNGNPSINDDLPALYSSAVIGKDVNANNSLKEILFLIAPSIDEIMANSDMIISGDEEFNYQLDPGFAALIGIYPSPGNSIYKITAGALQYNINFPSGGNYYLVIESSNVDSSIEQKLPGLAHEIEIKLDSKKYDYISPLASAPNNHQYSLATLKDVSAGVHDLYIDWLNDEFDSGVYDSNLQIYKLYLMHEDIGRDAVGIRIFGNNNHFSPLYWYRTHFDPGQQGNPQSILVNGYQAIREGRSIYVNAADLSDDYTKIFNDIYLISYNEGADSDTVNIYNRMLNHFHFNASASTSTIFGGGLTDFGECVDIREAKSALTDAELALYLPFDGNMDDISGNDYHAVCSSGYCPELTTETSGRQYYRFDSDDFIQVNHNFNTNRQIAIHLPIRFDALEGDDLGSNYTRVLSKSNYPNTWYAINVIPGIVQFEGADSNGCLISSQIDYDLQVGNWYDLDFMIDLDAHKTFYYINGDYIDSKDHQNYEENGFACFGNMDVDGFPLKIGEAGSSLGKNFKGAIDDIKIWNETLSAVEIEELSGAGQSSDYEGIYNCLTDTFCRQNDKGLCTSDKAKLIRDTRRLSDLQLINFLLDNYYQLERCNNDHTRLCYDSSQCYGGGECDNYYPNIEAGSYIAGRTFSVWPSWQASLGNILGSALPVDPINILLGCDDPYGLVTCWDEKTKKMQCPLDGWVYTYYSYDNGRNRGVLAHGEYDRFGVKWNDAYPFAQIDLMKFNSPPNVFSAFAISEMCLPLMTNCGDTVCGDGQNGRPDHGENCNNCWADCGCGDSYCTLDSGGYWGCACPDSDGDGIFDAPCCDSATGICWEMP